MAERHSLVPLPDTPTHARSALCRALLPDLFYDFDPAPYTAQMDDHGIAVGILGDLTLPPVEVRLPWKVRQCHLHVPDATLPKAERRLSELGLKVLRP